MGSIIVAGLLAIALLPQPTGPVDFSGSWKIDLERSLYPGNGLESHTLEIKQASEAITLNSAKWKSPLLYRLDGTETVEKGRTWETRTRARWDGATLIVEMRRVHHQSDGSKQETLTTDSFVLQLPDELVTTRLVKTARGDHGFKLVYRKQP